MSQSLVKILVHVVFSTKDRVPLIPAELDHELYAYINTVIENLGARLITANGTVDHSHFLISLGKANIVDVIATVKRSTSLWMKRKGVRDFYWQRGYGAFSVGQSQVTDVIGYIEKQKEHHAKHDFKDEFRALCNRYEVDLDERYCWE